MPSRRGPPYDARGDAYELNQAISAESAEEYHSVQLHTLKRAAVDMVVGMTFNNVPEAVGIARAAHRIGLPLSVSFTLDSHQPAEIRSNPARGDRGCSAKVR